MNIMYKVLIYLVGGILSIHFQYSNKCHFISGKFMSVLQVLAVSEVWKCSQVTMKVLSLGKCHRTELKLAKTMTHYYNSAVTQSHWFLIWIFSEDEEVNVLSEPFICYTSIIIRLPDDDVVYQFVWCRNNNCYKGGGK